MHKGRPAAVMPVCNQDINKTASLSHVAIKRRTADGEQKLGQNAGLSEKQERMRDLIVAGGFVLIIVQF